MSPAELGVRVRRSPNGGLRRLLSGGRWSSRDLGLLRPRSAPWRRLNDSPSLGSSAGPDRTFYSSRPRPIGGAGVPGLFPLVDISEVQAACPEGTEMGASARFRGRWANEMAARKPEEAGPGRVGS